MGVVVNRSVASQLTGSEGLVNTKMVVQARMTDRLVTRIGPANREFVRAGVLYRRNKGLKPGTIHGWANAMQKVDRILEGKPFQEATPDDLTRIITVLRASGLNPVTVHYTAVMMKQAWKDILEVDTLPRPYARALAVREPAATLRDRVVTEDEFKALLGSAAKLPGGVSALSSADQVVALLWAFWDTGFRAQELLGLNIGDVNLEDWDGAIIKMRPDAPGLKTGPRSVYVCECVPSMRVLLAFHPWRGNPNAPLFPGLRIGKAGRMQYNALCNLLHRLSQDSGVDERAGGKRLTAHDFRHTCATRKARSGWNEAQLRAYFGWKNDSRMASHYVHLALSDVKDRVRRDAGLSAKAGGDGATMALVEILRELLDERKHRQPGREPEPPP